jgi:hypothetical protein
MKEITRFEVIDETGRAYTRYNCHIELSVQDEGRTLKVFVKSDEKGQEQNNGESESPQSP